MRIFEWKINRLLAVLLLWIAVVVSHAWAEDTTQTIDDLIEMARDSGYTFIRNGREYSSEEAADHIARKYEQQKDKIHTVEDFIRLAATRSSMSGKKYMVRSPDGEVITSRAWLLRALRERRG